jgi:hypothetical protein
MEKKPKEGDVFEIPLTSGKKAYGWYLNYSPMGPLIQVFSLVSASDVTIDQVLASKPLFPPVLTGLFAAIKNEKWKIVGHKPVTNFSHPKFVSTLFDHRIGRAEIWYLWDGEKEMKIGPILPDEYKSLEFLVVWDPSNVVDRIETGEIPFPYAELIKNNRFPPFK